MIILGIITGLLVSFLFCFFCCDGDGRLAVRYLLRNWPFGVLIVFMNTLLYFLMGSQFNSMIEWVTGCFFGSLLLLIGWIDYRTSFVYRFPLIVGYVIGIGLLCTQPMILSDLIDRGLGVGFGFILIHLIIKLTDGMGFGDRDLAALCGLFLGFQGVFIMLFLAFMMGACFSIGLMLFKKIGLNQEVPFGPFIAISGILTLLYENQIVDLYWQLFN